MKPDPASISSSGGLPISCSFSCQMSALHAALTTNATQGETKTAATTPYMYLSDCGRLQPKLVYLGDHLIVPYYVTPAGVIKSPNRLIARWRLIFRYLGPTLQDSRELRFLCRLFRDSLHSPVWTTFPNPKFMTLGQLVHRINAVAQKDPSKAPAVVFISDGLHRQQEGDYILVDHSLTLIGESRLGTIVNGGFKVKGKRGLHVSLETMTIKGSPRSGIRCDSGVLHVKNVSFDGCGTCGVYVQMSLCTLIDCRMTNCKKGAGIKSGGCGIVHVHGATEVTGSKVGIDRAYGRCVLHAPMTAESAHDNGKNWNPNLPNYNWNSRGMYGKGGVEKKN